ncbi:MULTISPECIES: DUF4148 domain-containing protein [unclassified Herbaspirillum]|jgi:hypothetical protein|uniref:DUF4148 domain-containing protein n=1 Tax=unclassified Herbaspirillum TaxID=2624150 RepID=UPI000E2FC3AF|nr:MULTISPECIES: DUF4148 domain-containing protein [unclassified Herbaspirillum]RFB67946.1 DUF4148 domain-containing protein [Herbaspirillum sp. 3R-3a1]TFI06384.1 DUF4148 domain-containing protein [Herbaspirillum sp. 3R11]TFI14004.1 DUF4148 domain-containing protein [Herbaspirillum sp. 3R-11]TFI19737.1 DUF4148 domain-containing protein [Herbaspirillum sp. 3C11]
MNIAKIIAATALIAAAGSALAETPYPPQQAFTSTKTRAEVVAEVKQAGGDLGRRNYQDTFNPAPVASSKTRADVLAELSQTRGDVARNNYINTTR